MTYDLDLYTEVSWLKKGLSVVSKEDLVKMVWSKAWDFEDSYWKVHLRCEQSPCHEFSRICLLFRYVVFNIKYHTH